VVVPKGLPLAGTLIAMSERGLNAEGNLIAFWSAARRRASSRSAAARISISATRCCWLTAIC